MIMLRYETNQDVRMRLHKSICMYGNTPVFVQAIDELTTKVSLSDLKTGRTVVKSIDASDPDLKIESLPLGYAQYGSNAAFVFRVPLRQQKQGVSQENTRFLIEDWNARERVNNGFGVSSEGLYDTIMNVFPSFEDSLKKVNTGMDYISVPCDRKVAIVANKSQPTKYHQIRYATRTMALWDRVDKVALVTPPFDAPCFRNVLNRLEIPHEVINVQQTDS